METITAYSGGQMPCAIGIVRLSGDNALAIYHKIFQQKSTGKPRMMAYGSALARDGKVIDLCMGAFFEGPHSYTGEDMAEIYCHGSPAVVDELLRSAQQQGARLALAGEFTQRAFLHGKMDLTCAEAVGDLIHAQSLQSAKAAIGQVKGNIYGKIHGIYQEITGVLAHFYAVCDYTDEDIEDWQYEKAKEVMALSATALDQLRKTYDRGNTIKNGLPIAIVGKPNVGKSSLLNALLGYDRAIVTDEAGTTRDTIEECMQIGGSLFRLTDTAGLRQGTSQAERLGIVRSQQAAMAAKLVICVLDATQKVDDDDRRAIELTVGAEKGIYVLNKADMGGENTFDLPENAQRFVISATTGQGIDHLADYLSGLMYYDDSQVLITNARQAGLLEKAVIALENSVKSAENGMTADGFLLDAEVALRHLGELIGKTPNEDMIAEIFSKFCVGK